MILVAQAAAAPEEGFVEVLIWGICILLLVVALFVAKKWLRARAESAARAREITFGMSTADLEGLKKAGLSEEELKRIRQAMGRRFLERQLEEEKKRQLPPAAQAALARAEQEELAKKAGLASERVEEMPRPAARPPLTPPLPVQPPPVFAAPKARPAAPTTKAKPQPGSLPEELQRLLGRSDLEIDELVQAGFLSPEDARRVREAREQ